MRIILSIFKLKIPYRTVSYGTVLTFFQIEITDLYRITVRYGTVQFDPITSQYLSLLSMFTVRYRAVVYGSGILSNSSVLLE